MWGWGRENHKGHTRGWRQSKADRSCPKLQWAREGKGGSKGWRCFCSLVDVSGHHCLAFGEGWRWWWRSIKPCWLRLRSSGPGGCRAPAWPDIAPQCRRRCGQRRTWGDRTQGRVGTTWAPRASWQQDQHSNNGRDTQQLHAPGLVQSALRKSINLILEQPFEVVVITRPFSSSLSFRKVR